MSILKMNKRCINTGVANRFTLVFLLLMVAGCVKNTGQFSLNTQVDQAFRTGERQSDYHYFYSGRDTMPYAIIGIDQTYTVSSQIWIPFEPEPDQLRKMSANIYGQDRDNPAGYHILDTDKHIIGVWFSNVRFRSLRVDQHNRTVDVYFKNPENSRYY